MISRTPNAVLGKKPALARARQEEASVTDFHASMDVRLDAHSDRPDRVGHRESAMHDRAILITPLGEQLPRPCHKVASVVGLERFVQLLFGDRKEPRESSREPQTRYWEKSQLLPEQERRPRLRICMQAWIRTAHSDRPGREGR